MPMGCFSFMHGTTSVTNSCIAWAEEKLRNSVSAFF